MKTNQSKGCTCSNRKILTVQLLLINDKSTSVVCESAIRGRPPG